jgi:hypothetical protein
MEVILCVALCEPNFTVTAGLSTEMTAGTNQMVKFVMLFFQSYFTFDQARGVASYNAHGSLVNRGNDRRWRSLTLRQTCLGIGENL